jgi:hypothetical protein
MGREKLLSNYSWGFKVTPFIRMIPRIIARFVPGFYPGNYFPKP